jgi:hypothetical protein
MPKAMEAALEHEAAKKGLTGKRRNAYIYGTMRKTGWRPQREKRTAHDGAVALANRAN